MIYQYLKSDRTEVWLKYRFRPFIERIVYATPLPEPPEVTITTNITWDSPVFFQRQRFVCVREIPFFMFHCCYTKDELGHGLTSGLFMMPVVLGSEQGIEFAKLSKKESFITKLRNKFNKKFLQGRE